MSYLIFEFDLFLSQSFNLPLEVRDAHFCYMRLPVPENETALVEGLVCSKGHFQIVADSHEKDSSFREVDCRLPDDLIKQLIVELLSNGTDAALPCLFFYEFRFEGFLKGLKLTPAGLRPADIQSVKLALSFKYIRLEHFIEQVRVLGIKRGGFDRIEDRGLLVDFLILE
jgi:hypothetical protein